MLKRRPLDPETRRRRAKRRLIVYGLLIVALAGTYNFLPIEIDFIPRNIPKLEDQDPDSKKLFAKGTRVMVVTAHPDDSEFYIGGTLLLLKKAGAIIHQVIMTDGDKAFYFWADTSQLRATRQTEQREASSHYDVDGIDFMGYPDGRLRSNKETQARVAESIRQWKPDFILAFDGDFPPRISHRDHRRTGELIVPAILEAGFTGWLLLFSTQAPNYVVDVDSVWADRMSLLAIHKSQFYGEKLARVSAFIADSAANDGELRGYSFGEGFRAERFDGGFQVESKEFDDP